MGGARVPAENRRRRRHGNNNIFSILYYIHYTSIQPDIVEETLRIEKNYHIHHQ